MTSTTNQSKASTHQVVVTILSVVIVLLVILSVALWFRSQTIKTVASFEQCKQAGGALLESYPEQCLINGVTFANDKQTMPEEGSYVGMTEEDALARAEHENTPARVVERDGQSLPVTMDFVQGRHNFTIKDGKVTSVEIEGQAADTPLQE